MFAFSSAERERVRPQDLGEDASDELEDIEGLSVGVVEQAQPGIVV
jgi:hypothetical protein